MMRRLVLFFAVLGVLGAALLGSAQPARAGVNPFEEIAPPVPCDLGSRGEFFGFPFWYKYLKGTEVEDTTGTTVCRPHFRSPNDIWLIVPAVFEMVLILAGIAAIFMVIWGGILYITGRGQPDRLAAAQDTIFNALVGFVITTFSARIIGFVMGRFAGEQSNTPFGIPGVLANSNNLTVALTAIFQIAGALAVLFIVYGGITYARANGDPNTIRQAKNTVLYALIGLALVVFAQLIVSFVFSRLTS